MLKTYDICKKIIFKVEMWTKICMPNITGFIHVFRTAATLHCYVSHKNIKKAWERDSFEFASSSDNREKYMFFLFYMLNITNYGTPAGVTEKTRKVTIPCQFFKHVTQLCRI